METTQEEQMPTGLVPQEIRPPIIKLTAAEIKADVQLIQQVIKAVFKADVHFGVIPGTRKNTLYKPGAEKIMTMFRLNGEPLIDDLSSADELRYRIRVRITHQVTHQEIGWGVGECSSSETKYKWVKPVCNQEFDETPEDRRREKWMNGKEGKPYKQKQIRPNLQDIANTILKMAKKRALIDAVLTCTAASDVFDQDLEDLPLELQQSVADKATLPPIPKRASEKTPSPLDEQNDSVEDPPAARKPGLDLSKAERFPAKFEQPCKLCNTVLRVGQPILYMRTGADKGVYCVSHLG